MQHKLVLTTIFCLTPLAISVPATAQFTATIEQMYAGQVQDALSKLDIPLTAQEKSMISARVLELCRTRSFEYKEAEIDDFVHSLQVTVSGMSWGGLPEPAAIPDKELRELTIQENMLKLESGMDYYERSQQVLPKQEQFEPSIPEAFWERLSGILSETLATVPVSDQQIAIWRLRAAWQDIQVNKFSPAGKKPLNQGEMDRLFGEFAKLAKSCDAQLSHDLNRTLEDCRQGLANLRLDELLSSLKQICIIRTSLVLPYKEDDKSLRSMMESRSKMLEAISLRKTALLDARHRQIMTRLAKEDAQYETDRFLIDAGFGTLQDEIDKMISSVPFPPSPPDEVDRMVSRVSGTAPPSPDRAHKPLSDTASATIASKTVSDSPMRDKPSTGASSRLTTECVVGLLLSALGLLLVVIVVIAVVRRRRAPTVILFLLVPCLLAAGPEDSRSRELLSLATEADLSVPAINKWSSIVDSTRWDRNAQLTKCYEMVRPALLQDLRKVSREQMSLPVQNAYMSFVRDVAHQSMLHCAAESVMAKWPNDFAVLCATLYPSQAPSDVTEDLWNEGVSVALANQVQADPYRWLYAGLWKGAVAAEISKEWQVYCENSLRELISGRSYGCRITGLSRFGEGEEFANALACRLFLVARSTIRNTVMSDETRIAFRQARTANAR